MILLPVAASIAEILSPILALLTLLIIVKELINYAHPNAGENIDKNETQKQFQVKCKGYDETLDLLKSADIISTEHKLSELDDLSAPSEEGTCDSEQKLIKQLYLNNRLRSVWSTDIDGKEDWIRILEKIKELSTNIPGLQLNIKQNEESIKVKAGNEELNLDYEDTKHFDHSLLYFLNKILASKDIEERFWIKEGFAGQYNIYSASKEHMIMLYQRLGLYLSAFLCGNKNLTIWRAYDSKEIILTEESA